MLAFANTISGFLGKQSSVDTRKTVETKKINAGLWERTNQTTGKVTNGSLEGCKNLSTTPSRTNSASEGDFQPRRRTNSASRAGEPAPEELEGWRYHTNSRSYSGSLRKIDIQDVPEYLSDSDSDSEDDYVSNTMTVVERTSNSVRSVKTPGFATTYRKRVSLAEVDDECLSDDDDDEGEKSFKIQRTPVVPSIRINYTANVTVTSTGKAKKEVVTKAVIKSIKSLLNVEKTVTNGTLEGVKLTQMCPQLKVEDKNAKVSLFKRTFSNWFQVIPPQVKVDVALTAGDGTFHKENFTSDLHLDQYLGLAPRTRTSKKELDHLEIARKELEALDGMSKSELLNVVSALKVQNREFKRNSRRYSESIEEQDALKQMSREELMTVVATLKARVKFLRKFQTKLSFSDDSQ